MTAVAQQEKEKQDPKLIVADQPYSSRSTGTELARQQKPSTLMEALAAAATNPAMDVAKVEKLFAMHKELQDREAAQAFADAMAKAQANIRPIIRDRRNDHTKSTYATLAAIVDEITPIFTSEGLSVSFDSFDPVRDKDLPQLEKGWVRVVCFVSHRGGHVQRRYLDGPLDDKGTGGNTNKTGIQAMGSTVSYLRRYLVCMIFNVATVDDDDGNGGGKTPTGKRMDEQELLGYIKDIEEATTDQVVMRTFGSAWNKAQDIGDKDAQRRLTATRDARRKVLKGGRS